MKKEDIIRAAEQELQWLRYYATSETRGKFDPNRSPYDQLVSIGYTKRVVPLHLRCVFMRLTSETPIRETDIEQMVISEEPRNPDKNILSALEVVLLKYPETHD